MWVVGAYKSKLSKRVVCALWKFYVPVNALYTVSICASYCHWHGRVQYSVLSEGVRIPKTAPVSEKMGPRTACHAPIATPINWSTKLGAYGLRAAPAGEPHQAGAFIMLLGRMVHTAQSRIGI